MDNKASGISISTKIAILAAVLSLFIQCEYFNSSTAHAELRNQENVPLRWNEEGPFGQDKPMPDLSYVSLFKFNIMPFNDQRKEGQEIGRNISDQEKGKVYTITTNDNIPAWARKQFIRLMEEYGLNTGEDNKALSIQCTLLKLYVNESDRFRGNVLFRIEVYDPDKKLIWSGLTNGVSSRWGRTFKLENYYEAISYSFTEAVLSFLTDKSFQEALGKVAIDKK